MYNKTLFMDFYFKEGYNKLFELTKREYNLFRLNSDNDYNLLNDIYENLGFEVTFNAKSNENLVETVIGYMVSSNIALNPTELRVANSMKDKLEGNIIPEMKDMNIRVYDDLIVNLKRDILGKTGRQIKELMVIMESDMSCFKMFDQFQRGIINDKTLDKKVTEYLKNRVVIYREDTNIAIKEGQGLKIELYFPESEKILDIIDPIDYVKGLIYNELGDRTIGHITHNIKANVVNQLNIEGNLYTSAEKNPQLIFFLEYFCRRRYGLDTIEEVLNGIAYLGKVIDKVPNIMCYHGNLDKTVTLHVKNTEAIIDGQYLNVLDKDKSVEYFASRGVVYVTSKEVEGRVTLWEYLLGKGAKPKDKNLNNIVKDNIL